MGITAQKRKCSSPNWRPTKVLRRDEMVCQLQVPNGGPLCLDIKGVSKSSKQEGSEAVDPDRPLLKRHATTFKHLPFVSEQVLDGEEYERSDSPSMSCYEAEEHSVDLVITLDDQSHMQKDKLDSTRPRRLSESSQKEEQSDEMVSLEASSSQPSESDNSEDEFGQLDIDLERKSKQHNLTSVNIRTILHEVITNEHVVAMMKTAIQNTQDMPMFEPKMTRSRLKQVVEKGEATPTWDMSPIKRPNKVKPPQFVDIPLEDEEDSSDEEYCPDEDEEDETAEETFLESDVDSTASSPRIPRGGPRRTPVQHSESEEDRVYSPRQKPKCSRHLRVEVVPMGPPPPPSSPRDVPDSSFMERLHAVEEELALNSMCQPYQPIGGDGSSNGQAGLVSCRTRSKRPLRNIPLGQLEAELRAPDVTSDMYDLTLEEDHHWSQWLQSLMTSDGENEEGDDDDDDPEYNFLEDLVEPDREDYRTDKAVRITKKEVNELLEELFDTFQDELGANEPDEDRPEGDEEREEEEAATSGVSKFYVPQAIRFDAPLASMLTERRRAVREQYEALQQRRALQDTPGHAPPPGPDSSSGSSPESSSSSSPSPAPMVLVQPQLCPALTFNQTQKLQLQQQVQQHVQLLTQVHLLCGPVKALHHEACTTKQYLEELGLFAGRQEESHRARRPDFTSSFRACNLQGALELILEQQPSKTQAQEIPARPPRTRSGVSTRAYALLPQHVAWLLATRAVFPYPELLPHCSLDPALHPPRSRVLYTTAEDWLIAIGLKHFEDTQLPYQLMCSHLVRNHRPEHLRNHVREMCSPTAPENVIKMYCQTSVMPPTPVPCCRVTPGGQRPPVEADLSLMPNWLKKSLPVIHKAVMAYNQQSGKVPQETPAHPAPPYSFPLGTHYPPTLPKDVALRLHPYIPKVKKNPPPVVPKRRPFHAFNSNASLPPLAIAPPDAVRVPPPAASHGVVLLAKPQSTPAGGALPLVQVAVTPSEKAVPTSAVAPIGVSQKAVVQMSKPVPLSSTLVGQALLRACVMPTLANQKPTPTIKHSCIQPAPPPPPGHTSLLNNKGVSPRCVPERSGRMPIPNLRPRVSRALSRQRAFTRPLLPAPPRRDFTTECLPTAPLVGQRNTPGPVQDSSVPDLTDYVPVQMANQTLWVPKSCLVPSASVSHTDSLSAPPTKPSDQVLPSPAPVTPPGPPSSSPPQGLSADAPGRSLQEQLHRLVEGLQEGKEEVERERWRDSEPPPPPLLPDSCSGSCSDPDNENSLRGKDTLEHKGLNGTDDGRPEKIEGKGDLERRRFVSKPPASVKSLPVGERGGEKDKSDGEGKKEGENDVKGIVTMSKETAGGEKDGGVEQGGEGSGGGGEGGEEERNERNNKQGEEGGKDNGKREGEEGSQREEGPGGGKDGEGDKDGDQDRPGEEEEEEDFDELTQDEDEEEVMSSASEESVLSVPELQETMKKLTWLASERRLGAAADSEEDHSPNSPPSPASQNSQEENSEEEEEGPAKEEGLESVEGGASKAVGDEDVAVEGGARQAVGKGAGRGRGRARPPPRNLKRSRRQERDSKDAAKLRLLYDERILDNDPLRESKDVAFAQAYLSRVREALKQTPGRAEEFLGLLYEFERGTEGRSVVELFRQLRSVLDGQPELIKDFSAFLLPEQALECGLLEEQQAFERSRRFLRQLEISFGENPTHYQKIVKALQVGPVLSPANIEELKAQMSSLLKGHTHLQGEFGVFFDDMRPPPARPGQFEDAVWPEEGTAEGGEGVSWGAGGGLYSGFEEVTLPDLEEEEEGHKIRSRRRKIDSHGNYKECDWTEKECSCLSFDSSQEVKLRRHKRKGCPRCNCNKPTETTPRTTKSVEPTQNTDASPTLDLHTEGSREEKEEEKEGEKLTERKEGKQVDPDVVSGANCPSPGRGGDACEVTVRGPLPLAGEKEPAEDQEGRDAPSRPGPSPRKSRTDPDPQVPSTSEAGGGGPPVQPRPGPQADPPVCAKNISLTPSGEKVILWTREADRVILKTCQQQGAYQSTFQAISSQLGNKTASEVSRRFRDLMHLFRSAARQANSEEEAADQQAPTGF